MDILLIFHIASMTVGLVLAVSLAVSAVLGGRIARVAVCLSLAANVAGLVAGALLLLGHPIGPHCLMLTAYTAVFTVLHRYAVRHCRAHEVRASIR